MSESALIDTSVVLVTEHWVKDCNGEKVPLHEERREVRALAWDPMELTYPDMCHLLAISIAAAENPAPPTHW
jgi:hypothetical protein